MIHNRDAYLACEFVGIHGDAIGIDITDCYQTWAGIFLNMTSCRSISNVTTSARTASEGSLQEQKITYLKHRTKWILTY